MHVLLAVNDPATDPRALARLAALRHAGRAPMVVAVGRGFGEDEERVPAATSVARVRRGLLSHPGRATTVLERLTPAWLAQRSTAGRVSKVVGPEPCIHIVDRRAIDLAVAVARRMRGVVFCDPRWELPTDVDAAWRLAGTEPDDGADPGVQTTVGVPPAGRHEGRSVALCVRRTERTPGRYLESALGRAGVTVIRLQDEIDFDDLPADIDAVVIVESPLPPPRVLGRNPGVPVLFWVHHGEHHLDLNARLCRLFGTDVVLLAHSWHLAHRFPTPVERFPFAVAPELGRGDSPPSSRDLAVAFVGSGLDEDSDGDAYDARRTLVRALRHALGEDRVATASGLAPEEVVSLYASARVVPNEGGRRHRPITMRVFEAIGAGAVLASERVPGLDSLLRPNREYVPFGPDPTSEVAELVDDVSRLDAIAAAASARVKAEHTYDHRVDRLLGIIDSLEGQHRPPPVLDRPRDPVASVVAADVEVQRIVTTSPELALHLSDREVWPLERARLVNSAYEAAVIDRPVSNLSALVSTAWRYVYATQEVVAEVRGLVQEGHDHVTETVHQPDGVAVHRFDLHPASYRITPDGG